MRRSPKLSVERLEERDLPAVFGIPWPDARQLTVSFVPDGTSMGPSWLDANGALHQPPSSQLAGHLAGLSGWQQEILRALQTWAAETNVDLVVVPDSGDPLGTPGFSENDLRFGDIRIAGGQLSTDVVATSVPYSALAGTWAGDLIFNTRYPFGTGGYDLYTVALQEAGHVLGVGNDSTNPSSPMYEYYSGIHTGIGPSEISAVQALYGVRRPDAFEGWMGNDVSLSATPLGLAARNPLGSMLHQAGEDAGAIGHDTLTVLGDLTTRADVDHYAYRGHSSAPGFTVRLQTAGLSLLRGQLTVLDADGQTVASAGATSEGGELVLRVDAQPGRTYTIRVDGVADDVFAIGAYRLVVDPDSSPALDRLASIWERFQTRGTNNDTLARATQLRARAHSPAGLVRFAASGQIGQVGDVDYYRLRLPANAGSLTLQFRGTGAVGVAILDARGRVVVQQVGTGRIDLEASGLRPGKVYYLAISGEDVGAYQYEVQAGIPLAEPALSTTGTLSATSQVAYRGLVMPQTGVMHIEFAVSAPTATVQTATEVALFDLQGQVVYRQVVLAGSTLSVNLLLNAGFYTFRFVGGTIDGSPLTNVAFAVGSLLLSDPIGPALIDPTAVPPPDVPPTWVDDGFFVAVPIVDPYGQPIVLVDPAPPADPTPPPGEEPPPGTVVSPPDDEPIAVPDTGIP